MLFHLPLSPGGMLRFSSHWAPLCCQCFGCRAESEFARCCPRTPLKLWPQRLSLEALPHLAPAPSSSLISHLHVTCYSSLSFLPGAPQTVGSSRQESTPRGLHLSLPYTTIPRQLRRSRCEAMPGLSLPPSGSTQLDERNTHRPPGRLSFGGRETVEVG